MCPVLPPPPTVAKTFAHRRSIVIFGAKLHRPGVLCIVPFYKKIRTRGHQLDVDAPRDTRIMFES